jgi:hypothetical protein
MTTFVSNSLNSFLLIRNIFFIPPLCNQKVLHFYCSCEAPLFSLIVFSFSPSTLSPPHPPPLLRPGPTASTLIVSLRHPFSLDKWWPGLFAGPFTELWKSTTSWIKDNVDHFLLQTSPTFVITGNVSLPGSNAVCVCVLTTNQLKRGGVLCQQSKQVSTTVTSWPKYQLLMLLLFTSLLTAFRVMNWPGGIFFWPWLKGNDGSHSHGGGVDISMRGGGVG